MKIIQSLRSENWQYVFVILLYLWDGIIGCEHKYFEVKDKYYKLYNSHEINKRRVTNMLLR